MIKKVFTPKRTVCKVTFRIPGEWAEETASIVGDFNNWDPESDILAKKNGSWETTLRFKPETEYKFRYFLDGSRWANDEEADDYLSNSFGTEDSFLKVGK